MGRVAAIGERVAVQGFGLAGAVLLPAETGAEAADRWAALPDDIEVVILTPMADRALPDRPDVPLTVVMP